MTPLFSATRSIACGIRPPAHSRGVEKSQPGPVPCRADQCHAARTGAANALYETSQPILAGRITAVGGPPAAVGASPGADGSDVAAGTRTGTRARTRARTHTQTQTHTHTDSHTHTHTHTHIHTNTAHKAEGTSPGADVAEASPVPVQMWHSPGADVAG